MAEQVKPDEKESATEVIFEGNNKLRCLKDQVNRLSSVVGVDHFFNSDNCSFDAFCGIINDCPVVGRVQRQYLKNKIIWFYDCENFTDWLFGRSIVDVLTYLKHHTKLQRDFNKYPSKFLGVSSLVNLKTKESSSLDWCFVVWSQVNYFTGYSYQNQFEGEKETIDKMFSEHESMKKEVYFNHNEAQWEIKTEEGDLLQFNNIYEVCCWTIARTSNYNPEKMTKENW